MNPTRIEEAVDAALTPVRSAIVTAACTAYARVTTKYHDTDDGCDAQTFGLLVYKFITHRISSTARDSTLGIEIPKDTQAFRFRIGGFRFGTYALGPHAVESIEDSFPNNDGAAGELALDNLQYWLQFPNDDVYLPRSLVIGHLGNWVNGCEQIWIAEPRHTESGAITGWGWRKELWRWDGMALQRPLEPSLPQAVRPTPVVLTLKRARRKPTA